MESFNEQQYLSKVQSNNQYPMLKLSLILATSLISLTYCIYPTPKFLQIQSKVTFNGCSDFPLSVSEQLSSQIGSLQNRYYWKVVERIKNKCSCEGGSHNIIPIQVTHDHSLNREGYRIQTSIHQIDLQISSYSGFIYSLETLSQMFTRDCQYQIGKVFDEPLVPHRGIMIDSVRHFLPIQTVRRLIESMPVSKLNVLHWHLADDQAFVLELAGHPELAEGSSYTPDSFYSLAQIRNIISLAEMHGVAIVPELDTPGHVRSWGLAEAWKTKNITILCPRGEGYNHQFDVSMNDTYKLVSQVLKEVDDIFKSAPYIHLGGDEVFGSCWNLRPAIQTFMTLKNIKNYGELQMFWRYQLKQALPHNRKTIFWLNTAENVTTGPDDILQYWGAQANTATVTKDSQSKLILSPTDYLYFNHGKGNIWQNVTAGLFRTWREIYENFTIFPEGVDRSRIIGGEVCLWGQVSNAETLENNIWMRASSFAGKVWSEGSLPLDELVTELSQVQQTLEGMGVQPSPMVSEFCEKNPKKCFGNEEEVDLVLEK